MFRRVEDRPAAGQLSYEGRDVPFCQGDSVAAALLAAGIASLGDAAVDGTPRAPYCMMGICFDCLCEIDNAQNRQACLTLAQPGMVVHRQRGARQIR